MFCDIVAGRSLANVRYEDEDILVFDNQLDWVPIMLLIIPKCHLTQIEFWSHPDLMLKASTIALVASCGPLSAAIPADIAPVVILNGGI